MKRQRRHAELYLNGEPVGKVRTEAASRSFGVGHFTPDEAFSKFSTLFGSWAMLLHEDEEASRASKEALEELRKAEMEIDAIKAELLWLDSQQRTPIGQLTIDGELIEWKPQESRSDG